MSGNITGTVLVSAAGTDGVSGVQVWDDTNHERARFGARGRDGRDSPFPTHGAPGGQLDVAMGFNPNRPGFVQMTGEGAMAGAQWEVAAEAEFLLSVRGGNGGAGGVGEAGQDGGHGHDGRDATKHRNGEVST